MRKRNIAGRQSSELRQSGLEWPRVRSLLAERPQETTVKWEQARNFFSKEEVTMKQGTSLGSQLGRWIILAALVVALGALLLTIRPVGAQTDGAPVIDDAPAAFTHAENS